jgi:hypothetical protein
MLNREVCFKCYKNEYTHHTYESIEDWDVSWKKGCDGYFLCALSPIADQQISIHGSPPRECPYKLEHAVAVVITGGGNG